MWNVPGNHCFYHNRHLLGLVGISYELSAYHIISYLIFHSTLLTSFAIKKLSWALQHGPDRPAPVMKSGKTKGCSATNKVTGEYTITAHTCIRGVRVKTCAPWVLRETQTFAMREMGTSNVCLDTRRNKALRAKTIRNVSSRMCMHLSRKCNEAEDSPNKLRLLVYLSPLQKKKKKKSTES